MPNDTHGGRTTTTSNGIGNVAPDGSAPIVLALRPKEAALALGISERLLWSKTNCGEIPHCRINRTVVYPIHLLKEYLTDNAKGGDDR
jgi:hypothetical protein